MTPSADGSGLSDEFPARHLEPEEMDRLFEALASAERRVAVEYLAECDGTARFDDVVEVVAERTADGDASHEERSEVKASLYHVHLPKLESADLVVDSDPNGVVEASDRVSDLPDDFVGPS